MSMRAGYYMGNYSYEVKEVPEPEPKGSQVKIRVAWCGLCGTDIHKFQGKNGASPVVPPVILGHEVSGIVEEVGSECTEFAPGDRVVCNPNFGCGECEWCQRGLPNFCVHRHDVSRGFADYVCPPKGNVYHIPDSLDLEDAAFAEPLSCVVHGLDLLQMESGRTVIIFGMGAIGLLALQLVRLSGAGSVIVVEREASKRGLALSLGADAAVDDAQVESFVSNINADYVIECIGFKQTMEQAIRVAGKKSKVLLFGLGDPDERISFDQYEAFTKELALFTSYLNPNTTDRAVALLSSGKLETRRMISAELELEDMGEELKTLKNARNGKVMVRLSGEH
jgi:L-iditol 2-dehydrogenase